MHLIGEKIGFTISILFYIQTIIMIKQSISVKDQPAPSGFTLFAIETLYIIQPIGLSPPSIRLHVYMEWSSGVEYWSGVLEWSIAVEWNQILEWQM